MRLAPELAAGLAPLRARIAELERERAPARREFLPTGFPELDRALGGGFHAGALNEIVLQGGQGGGQGDQRGGREGSGDGSGVLEAFLPAFAGARLLAWIDPARVPYPPALAQAGLDLSRLLLVRPHDAREHGFALDLALRCGACDVLVTWIGAFDPDFQDGALRRLQLAAEKSGACALCLRPAGGRWRQPPPSPAAVRLAVTPLPSAELPSARRRLRVAVLRCRGAAPRVQFGGESLVLEWSRDPLDESPTAALRARTPATRFALGA